MEFFRDYASVVVSQVRSREFRRGGSFKH
jgi:hypothetical protein